jgi:hypothetical protein
MAAGNACGEAEDALFDTPAETLRGLRAIREYANGLDELALREFAPGLVAALLKSPLLAV